MVLKRFIKDALNHVYIYVIRMTLKIYDFSVFNVIIWPFKGHKKVPIQPLVSNFKNFSSINLWKAQDHVCGTVKVTFLQFLYLFSSKMVIFESAEQYLTLERPFNGQILTLGYKN